MWSKCLEQALRQLPRSWKVQVATKNCGIRHSSGMRVTVKGSPEYVRACREAILQLLAINYIDLYLLHRIDQPQPVPIEESVCIT
jgi:aryl-alcohol dehydrogenase-like predicted oxidoreductase